MVDNAFYSVFPKQAQRFNAFRLLTNSQTKIAIVGRNVGRLFSAQSMSLKLIWPLLNGFSALLKSEK
jgi:hypothetical protein